jgi:hypothetical protein
VPMLLATLVGTTAGQRASVAIPDLVSPCILGGLIALGTYIVAA